MLILVGTRQRSPRLRRRGDSDEGRTRLTPRASRLPSHKVRGGVQSPDLRSRRSLRVT